MQRQRSSPTRTDPVNGSESSTRGELLLRALTAAGAVGVGGLLVGSLAGPAASAPSPAQDVRILNYFLLLEYLQQGLYEEARAAGGLNGELNRFAAVAARQEREHVASLRSALGGDARSKPEFQFGEAIENERRFSAAAVTLEEAAAAAYIGQAANLTTKRIPMIARMVPVEARHAAWIRGIVGREPAPHAADPAREPHEVEQTIERTGFVKRR